MECHIVSKLIKMWTKVTTIKIKKDKQLKECKRSINVNEEYQEALRSKSFGDFLLKAHLLVQYPSLSMTQSCCNPRLLQPDQATVALFLESETMSANNQVKGLIRDYFDISSEASKICTKILKSIMQVRSSYASIQQIFNMVVKDCPIQSNVVNESKLSNLITTYNNPFANISKQDFGVICNKYSLALGKTKRKKIKMINCFNKASGICVTAACGIVAVTAMGLAAHTLTTLVMGPLIISLPMKSLKKKLRSLHFLKSRLLKNVRDQLDVAMKVTYILNRDFDTMIRLVNRLHDETERKRRMIELCLEKGCGEYKIYLQILKEIEKSDVWFKKEVVEIEEHVYLSLLTINKARALLMKELSRSCEEKTTQSITEKMSRRRK